MKQNFLETTYAIEEQFLSPYAVKSAQTKGRQRKESSDNLRTEFARDRDRILHSKAFRRLKHKTQVFLAPEGDHYRTRLTHTLEVSQIARTMARALRLNEDLAEAISLGHDLGHTPYGHAGERALDAITPFSHAAQSLRVVEVLEKDGQGMNLTAEVRDGILNHTSKGNPNTLEGQLVTWADRIAYINHDIDDALRARVLAFSDIPISHITTFGDTHAKRINSMILDIIHFSGNKNFVRPSDAFVEQIADLRQFMFDNVYLSGEAKEEDEKAAALIAFLYDYYLKNPDKLPLFIQKLDTTASQRVCDFISMMSDRFASAKFKELTTPKGWSKL